MKNLAMKAYKVSNIQLKNTLQGGTRLELQNKYSHNVKYSNNNACEGILKVDINDKSDNDNFKISVTVQGLFQYEGEITKERLHVETFKELFPYARSLVTTITANAGMPPIIIPPIDIESQEIYRIDMNPDNLNNKDAQ